MTPMDQSLGDEFLNFNGGDGDDDDREGDEPEPKPSQTTRDPLREEPTVILDGNSDLDQKFRSALGNLCGGRHRPLLLQVWTKATKKDGPFVLKTQCSHSFLVAPNDALCQHWEACRRTECRLHDIPRVYISEFCSRSPFASLWLSVYLPVREQGCYEEKCVGMLEIASNTIETCLQFVKEARVYDLFQLNVSTQGREVPSNDFVDNTEQFTPKGDLNDKDQFVRASNDFVDNTNQFTPKGVAWRD
ncbi:hypothetical protein HYC85_026136 [Camellia sinensis]|uniref:Uncharacterized protein n=1 Tax=Camellia sinensis TaxID=4442 RepID=A0A7J7G3A9_CAMSI|nr:hypothetical protein HYC85_026136 [Camellia sinensis]